MSYLLGATLGSFQKNSNLIFTTGHILLFNSSLKLYQKKIFGRLSNSLGQIENKIFQNEAPRNYYMGMETQEMRPMNWMIKEVVQF